MKNGWQTGETSFDAGILSNPLSFLRSGSFIWDSAYLAIAGSSGLYWPLRSNNTSATSSLLFNNSSLDPQSNAFHGAGHAVRCESGPLQILHHSH